MKVQDVATDKGDYIISLQKISTFNIWNKNSIDKQSYFLAILIPKAEVLYIQKDILSKLEKSSNSSVLLILLFSIGFTIFFIVIAGLFALNQTKQIRLLSNVASQVRVGNKNASVAVVSKDELGDLAILFNDMISDLYTAQLKLEEYTKGLEAEVLDRTKDLTEANETKDKFFSIIDHDLRGPIGNLSVIFNEIKSGKIQLNQNLLDMLSSSTQNVYQLLEDLLTWAKSQKKTLEISPTDIKISDLIKNNIILLKTNAEKKEINITFKDAIENLWVHADKLTVSTIIRNLIQNAIKFTHSKGIITIFY